jgi:hypothetical protein
MRLALGEVEEQHRVSERVAPEPGGAQHRIGIGDGQRRVVGAHERPFRARVKLDLAERAQARFGLALQNLGPALEALAARQARGRGDPQVGKGAQLFDGLVFHGTFSLGEKTAR